MREEIATLKKITAALQPVGGAQEAVPAGPDHRPGIRALLVVDVHLGGVEALLHVVNDLSRRFHRFGAEAVIVCHETE